MQKNKMQKTILGFVPVESPVYGIHPMVRLIIYFTMSMIPLCVQMPELNLLLFVLLLGLFKFARIQFRSIRMFFPMMVTVGIFIMLVYNIFPVMDSQRLVMAHIGGLKIYYHSFMMGISVYLRIIVLIFASIFYFFTNRERDILIAFRELKAPFAVSYFIGLTLRSAGMFIEDYRTIQEAERSRGMFTEDLSFFAKIRHFAMYMIPLFTLAIRKSDEISIALYAKGTSLSNKVNGKKRPDYLLHQTPVHVGHWVQAAIGVLVIVVFVYLNAKGMLGLDYSPVHNLFLHKLMGGTAA